MRYEVPPAEARFGGRLNRFTVEVEVGGRREAAHLPNSGRLRELLLPGAPCLLLPHPRAADAEEPGREPAAGPPGRSASPPGRPPARRTRWDLVAVRFTGSAPGTRGGVSPRQPWPGQVGAPPGGAGDAPGPWVSVDARLPPLLLAEALAARRLRPFAGWRVLRREPRIRAGRFDLLLEEEGTGALCHVEAKSVTLVVGGEARFPDAPTERGRRHLEELARLAASGRRACVCFVVQRPDARWFAPNGGTDPAFAAALGAAAKAGVEVRAWRCCTARSGVIIRAEIPVRGVS